MSDPNQSNPWLATRSVSGAAYDATYERRAAAGEDVHGEAGFIMGLRLAIPADERGVHAAGAGEPAVSKAPASVLDAGCGTGRVARELARRGIDATGADIDPEMLGTARQKAPEQSWHLGDLADIDLGRTFDCVAMAGNVMIFLAPGTEGAVVSNMARHLNRNGRLVAGFQLNRGMSVAAYDRLANEAGLELAERWSTWDRDPWTPQDTYAVSVHRWKG